MMDAQKIPSIYELMGIEPADAPGKKSKEAPDPDDPLYEIVKVKKTMTIHQARRINSELALEQSLPWHFEPGVTYHCISFGDVDSLTYFRVILKQQKFRYAVISTWCMAPSSYAKASRHVSQSLLAGRRIKKAPSRAR